MQAIEFVDLPKINPGPPVAMITASALKSLQLERLQIHRDQPAANLMIVEHEREHLPAFVFVDLAGDFPLANLLVECVQKLLAGRGSGECRAVMQRSAKAAKIEQAFLRARERHAHAIKQINDRRRHVAHAFDRRLVREKVAAVNRVVEMLRRRIAFAFRVDRAVDPALRADRVRALYRHDRDQIDIVPRLRDLHRRRKTRKPAADDRDF